MRAPTVFALFAVVISVGISKAADMSGLFIVAAPIADATCANRGVLGRIQSRFNWSERTLWHRGFVIHSLSNPRPSNHRFSMPGIIKRDYCLADSVMTNGAKHPVYYAIEHGQGLASIGNYVDFCVLGLDPWHVHDGECRTVR
jgi:hypothetical protein